MVLAMYGIPLLVYVFTVVRVEDEGAGLMEVTT
jgi:hypothetical protein